jgi:hypothetical protein
MWGYEKRLEKNKTPSAPSSNFLTKTPANSGNAENV